MVDVGRDLWRSPGPTPLLKKGRLKPVAEDCIRMAFEHLQGGRLHNLPGQPVPVLAHHHSENMTPPVQREPPMF